MEDREEYKRVIDQQERSLQEAHFLDECELALLIGILNSSGS
jgi:hypothetical protein